MPPLTAASFTSSAAQLPPKTLISPRPQLESHTISRRNAAVLLSSIITPLIVPPLASAFSLGISGPKEWLKDQKRKSARFVLAPIGASRDLLQSAYLRLMKGEQEFDENESEQFQELLVSAARDCVPKDRNSFVEFQANTGVEVCTFRLILNNASSLLADKDPIKLEAEAKLTALIGSFASLTGMARGDVQLTSNRQRVADALKDTISSLVNFEQGIKDCLEA